MIIKYYRKNSAAQCPNCGHEFRFMSFLAWIIAPHLFDKYRFWKCPKCGVRTWMRMRKEK